MATTITWSSLKGGSGKTTCTIMTANNLAARGKKVLVIDLDINNSTTMYYLMGVVEDVGTQNVATFLNGFKTLPECTIQSRIPNIDILPSSLSLIDLRAMNYKKLTTLLESARNEYDYILIDTAPTYDNIVESAYLASDLIFTPIELDTFTLTTLEFMKSKLIDSFEKQYANWYLLVNHWSFPQARYEGSIQAQFFNLFLEHFPENICDVKLPEAESTCKRYLSLDEKLSQKARGINSQRMWEGINQLLTQITGEEETAEVF